MRRREFIGVLGGTVASWPVTVRAQHKPRPVIGYLHVGSPSSTAPNLVAFRKALAEAGYIEGQNVSIEYRHADGRFDRLPVMAKELVDRRVDVIVAAGGSTAAVKAATSEIPVVGMSGGDPVRAGFVQSLNRPGGNITGIALFTNSLGAKRFELLREAVPTAKLMGVLVDQTQLDPEFKLDLGEVEAAARKAGQQISIVNASTVRECEMAFEMLQRQGAASLLAMASPNFLALGKQLAGLAGTHAIPAIYQSRDVAVAGGLMTYGIDFLDAYRQLGIYAAKLLKGVNPAELPMQQLTKIELVINLRTAKALGLTFPLALLGRADEVIE